MKNAQVQLFDQMLAVFSEEDLIELCFRLHIEYADLNGKNRRAKMISLIETCQYTGQIAELVKLCQEQRPFVNWPTVVALQTNPPESAAAFEQALDEAAQPDEPLPTPSTKPALKILPVWVWGVVGLLLLALVVVAVWQPWNGEEGTAVTMITNPSNHNIALNQAVRGKLTGSGAETWTYTGSRDVVDIRLEGGPDDDFVLILTYQDGGQAVYADFSGRGAGELLKYYDLQENMRIVVDEAENDGAEYTLYLTRSQPAYLAPGETQGGEIRGANPEVFLFDEGPATVDIILEMTNAAQPWLAVYRPDGTLLISAEQLDENGRLTLTNLALGDGTYDIVLRDGANDGAVYRIEMRVSGESGAATAVFVAWKDLPITNRRYQTANGRRRFHRPRPH
ncbi:MAG: hypothetical protein KJ069_12575 [Anaerolineae bacterium]|nr:hypothetical protein [Anaerolineae bacterium]